MSKDPCNWQRISEHRDKKGQIDRVSYYCSTHGASVTKDYPASGYEMQNVKCPKAR